MFASRLGILLVAHDFPRYPDDLSQLAPLDDVEALAIPLRLRLRVCSAEPEGRQVGLGLTPQSCDQPRYE